jgi:peptidoglycan/LPS O-acetylase OafA/YrhL
MLNNPHSSPGFQTDQSKANPVFTLHHIPQLDGFRGLAVLLVVLGHGLQGSGGSLAGVGASAAELGVLLFFVLSGFLITGLLMRERAKHGNIDLRAFYFRRILRLAPAFLLFFTVVAGLTKLKLITDVPKYEFAVCLLYVRNIFGRSWSLRHLWSLSLEEQFYMIWPWVTKLVRVNQLLPIAATATGLIALVRTVGIYKNWYPYEAGIFYMKPWFRCDSILIGCCLFLACQSSRILARIRATLARIPAFWSWNLLVAWTFLGEGISRSLYITAQTLAVTLVLGYIVLVPGRVTSMMLTNAVIRALGNISYSLYLWQQLFLQVQTPTWGKLRVFPLSYLMPMLCALFSFYFVESPALRLKRSFER